MRELRRDLGQVFLLLFLTYAGFVQAASWGSAARFDLARALVEQGTLNIDAYHENTGDKALAGGHVYSDKAPLPSFLATLGVASAHAVREFSGAPVAVSMFLAVMGGLATLFSTGVVVASGGVGYFLLLKSRGVDRKASFVVVFLVFLGTTIFPYATLLQGHAAAAAWLIWAFHLWIPQDSAPSLRRCAWGGAAASAALATEYLTGPPLLLFALAALAAPGNRFRRAAAMFAGALPGLVLLGAYHNAAFGGPFTLGYQTVALPFFRERMSSGILGVHLPDPKVALQLLVEPYRGLFPSSPLLLLALAGLLALLREPRRRRDAAVALAVFIYYWLLQSGHATWNGGWAIGPRHVVPAIPFLGLGLLVALASWKRATTVAAALSVALMLAVTSVGPEVPEDIVNPYADYVLPYFFRGEFSVSEQGFGDLTPARLDPAVPDAHDAFLVGELVHLPGHLALLPTILVWAVLSPWGFLERLRTPSSNRIPRNDEST